MQYRGMSLDVQRGSNVGGRVLRVPFEDAAAGGLSGPSLHPEETEQGVLECSPTNIRAASLVTFQDPVGGEFGKDAPQRSH
ncbi:hypothetical protein GCM10007175_21380 [Pseudarthrobacter scleromae]|uniref:Uncharacterized protein n=1 Tax=Pseudarthrobacter scleromae TaxID=158897 RepID=A0ABQ2CEP9_9MICC|nr:hypothetical protein GCM10007175_21380 [Pseudarthrobacter scleromae]